MGEDPAAPIRAVSTVRTRTSGWITCLGLGQYFPAMYICMSVLRQGGTSSAGTKLIGLGGGQFSQGLLCVFQFSTYEGISVF